MTRAIAALVAALSAGFAGSCAPIATQLVVVVRSEVPVVQMRAVQITVLREGSSTPIVAHNLPTAGLSWPISFGVIAADPMDTRPLLATATLDLVDLTGPARIHQIARVSLRPGHVLQLDLELNRDCLERTATNARCVYPQTCSIGVCVAIDRSNLPELTP